MDFLSERQEIVIVKDNERDGMKRVVDESANITSELNASRCYPRVGNQEGL